MAFNPFAQALTDFPGFVIKVPGIDGLSTDPQLILTTQPDKGLLFITNLIIINKSLVGIPLISTVIFDIGSNDPDYDNAATGVSKSSTDAIDNFTRATMTSGTGIGQNTDVYLQVTTAVTLATEYTFDLYCVGFYESTPTPA